MEFLMFSENFPVTTADFNGFKVDLPYPDLGADTSACAPLALVLNAENPEADTYSWSTGESTSAVSITQAGDYAVTITAESSCFSAADTVRILESSDCDSVPEFCPLVIPNAFTPNDDDVNDIFYIPEANLYKFEIAVYDRWGNRVFYSDNPNFRWNGDSAGKRVASGVYVYVMSASSPRKADIKRSGTLTIVVR